MQTIKIGISPCPNDTFIFENMYNGILSIPNVNFEWEFHDIDILNKKAAEGYFDVVKVSFAHLQNIEDQYIMLQSGGAMGYGLGPLLVKKAGSNIDFTQDIVAIPGKNTTANFLFSYFYPEVINKEMALFNEIEDGVLDNKYSLGVLIHESRFTYAAKGLELIADLGTLWQDQENIPIPLGCIVVNKSLSEDLITELEKMISKSITNYDINGRPIVSDFIRSHAKEMDETVIKSHIDLYVNDFSVHIGDVGMTSIKKMRSILNTISV
jgi:1,4-dihydroxy-6-naphthoate synthase